MENFLCFLVDKEILLEQMLFRKEQALSECKYLCKRSQTVSIKHILVLFTYFFLFKGCWWIHLHNVHWVLPEPVVQGVWVASTSQCTGMSLAPICKHFWCFWKILSCVTCCLLLVSEPTLTEEMSWSCCFLPNLLWKLMCAPQRYEHVSLYVWWACRDTTEVWGLVGSLSLPSWSVAVAQHCRVFLVSTLIAPPGKLLKISWWV